jgi:hypothetical protein
MEIAHTRIKHRHRFRVQKETKGKIDKEKKVMASVPGGIAEQSQIVLEIEITQQSPVHTQYPASGAKGTTWHNSRTHPCHLVCLKLEY